MRQTEDMENHIRRLAGCDRQESVTAEEPSFEKKEVADSVKVKNETGAPQEMMLSSADGSHDTQGLDVFESAGVPNEEATPRGEETKEAEVVMPAAEHPLLLAVEQQPAQLRRYWLAKQSGVPNIRWNCTNFAWKVNFPKVDSKGEFISWTSRAFAVKKFMVQGRSEAEADAAALEVAKIFRAELVEKGILREPRLKDPSSPAKCLVSHGERRRKGGRCCCTRTKGNEFMPASSPRRQRLRPRLVSFGRSMACSSRWSLCLHWQTCRCSAPRCHTRGWSGACESNNGMPNAKLVEPIESSGWSPRTTRRRSWSALSRWQSRGRKNRRRRSKRWRWSQRRSLRRQRVDECKRHRS